MSTNHKPATALPWSFDRGRIDTVADNLPAVASTARAEDGRYIAHSANAYPKLVEMLEALADSHESANARALLRELGEGSTYWDEKRKDRREEFLEEDATNAERAYPTRRPS
jgi:hypothetical protein